MLLVTANKKVVSLLCRQKYIDLNSLALLKVFEFYILYFSVFVGSGFCYAPSSPSSKKTTEAGKLLSLYEDFIVISCRNSRI